VVFFCPADGHAASGLLILPRAITAVLVGFAAAGKA